MHNENNSYSHLPGSDTINQFKLKNGIQVLSFENKNAETVYMIGILSKGGDHDPKSKTGLAHFTANMLSRGTENIPFQEFHSLIEATGANLAFSCSSRHIWFRGKSLAEDLPLLFRLSSDALRYPAFNEKYVERLRRQLLAGLALRDQDTGEIASMLFDQNLFRNHPYGLPVDGFVNTINSISRDDIIDFHHQYFTPDELIIVIAGAVSSATIQDLAKRFFGDWQPVAQAQRPGESLPPTPSGIIRKHRYLEGKSQVDLIMGGFGPARTSPDYPPAAVGNNILGQFGLMGRIGRRVRSDAGLAYFASSSISAWSETGTWDISAGVNPENAKKVIELIRDEIRKFISCPVTDEELANSKSHLIGRLPMGLETNAGIANAILTMHRFNLGLDYYRKYQEMVSAITPEAIRTVGQKYLLPDRLVITSAGPGEEIA